MNDPKREELGIGAVVDQSLRIITSVALITASTESPSERPSRSTDPLVMTAATVCPTLGLDGYFRGRAAGFDSRHFAGQSVARAECHATGYASAATKEGSVSLHAPAASVPGSAIACRHSERGFRASSENVSGNGSSGNSKKPSSRSRIPANCSKQANGCS